MRVQEIVQDLSVWLPGLPEMTVEQGVVRAARRFSSDVYAWKEKVLDVDVDQPPNPQEPDDHEGEIVSLTAIELDGAKAHGFWDGELIHVEEGGGRLVVEAALRPKQGSSEIPPAIAFYAEAIKVAAAAELMMVPGGPWTQPELAEHHGYRYQAEVARARTEINRQRSTQPLQVRPRRFV